MRRRLLYCVLLFALAPIGYAASAPAFPTNFAWLDDPHTTTDPTTTDPTTTDLTTTDLTTTDLTTTDLTTTDLTTTDLTTTDLTTTDLTTTDLTTTDTTTTDTSTTTSTTTVPNSPPSPPAPPQATTVPPTTTAPGVTIPPSVTNLTATAGDGTVKLTYEIPAAVDHVVIRRSADDDPEHVVYRGTATTFTDRGLQNGIEYRYVVTSVDAAGHNSADVAIAVTPKRNLLRSPKEGARLRKAPKLVWLRDTEASYYNLQLYRGSRKILSVWPKKPTRALPRKWKFEGHSYSLVPGVYTWFVWPGYGPRSNVDYGDMMGSRTFRIVR
jgi:hypothetical protein